YSSQAMEPWPRVWLSMDCNKASLWPGFSLAWTRYRINTPLSYSFVAACRVGTANVKCNFMRIWVCSKNRTRPDCNDLLPHLWRTKLELAGPISALCPRPPVAGFGPGLFLPKFVAETFHCMVVDHSCGLHEGVADGRA